MVQLAGLIGDSIAHSPSPAMQNAAFAALGIAARYELWPATAAELPARVRALREPGMLGANVTIPHKLAVVSLLDDLGPSAREVGAVNTIVARGGPLVGHNTDAAGLAAALREAGREHSASGVVLGAGGAARAALVALRRLGARRVTLLARDPAPLRGAGLGTAWRATLETGATTFALLPAGPRAPGDVADALATADVIVNATPVGSAALPGMPLGADWLGVLPTDALVVDLIASPTAWLAAARALGLATLDGRLMLLWQGALAFSLWTAQPAPLAAMRAALSTASRDPAT